MKKIKGLLAVLMILTLMVGNIQLVSANGVMKNSTDDGRVYTTCEDPNPGKF